MAKLKKLLKRAAEISHLPFPERSPAREPLAEPIDLITRFVRAWDAKDAGGIGELFVPAADTNVSREGRLTGASYIKGPSPEDVAAAEWVDD